MSGQVIQRATMVVMVVWAAGGCAAKQKQRIALLEETNRNLTERLNFTQNELDGLSGDRDDLDQRLQATMDEINTLRQDLAERPVTGEAPQGWKSVPAGAMISIAGNVLFEPGRVVVRKEARKTLDAIVSTVQGEYADRGLLVFGHTDDQPIRKSGWTDNYQLSTERALAVVRYLRDRGVSPDRLVACGYGENRPLVPNSSNTNRRANRRVELFAVDMQLLAYGP